MPPVRLSNYAFEARATFTLVKKGGCMRISRIQQSGLLFAEIIEVKCVDEIVKSRQFL